MSEAVGDGSDINGGRDGTDSVAMGVISSDAVGPSAGGGSAEGGGGAATRVDLSACFI